MVEAALPPLTPITLLLPMGLCWNNRVVGRPLDGSDVGGAGTWVLQVPHVGGANICMYTHPALIAATKLIRKSLEDLDVVPCVESGLRKEYDIINHSHKNNFSQNQ